MNDDLSELATKVSLKKKAAIFLIALTTMFAATIAWTVSRPVSIGDPPATWNVDGVFYDNIACNLNLGEGFVVNLQAQPG